MDELLTFSPRFHVRYDVAVIEGKAECRLLTCLCPQPKTRAKMADSRSLVGQTVSHYRNWKSWVVVACV